MWSEPEEDEWSDTEENVEDFVNRFREVMKAFDKEEDEKLAQKAKKGTNEKTLPCPSSPSEPMSSPTYSNSSNKTTTDSVETVQIDEDFVDEDDELTEIEDDSPSPDNSPRRPIRLKRAPARFENYYVTSFGGGNQLKSQPKLDAKDSGVKLASNSSPQTLSSSGEDGSKEVWNGLMEHAGSAKILLGQRVDDPLVETVNTEDSGRELQSA